MHIENHLDLMLGNKDPCLSQLHKLHLPLSLLHLSGFCQIPPLLRVCLPFQEPDYSSPCTTVPNYYSEYVSVPFPLLSDHLYSSHAVPVSISQFMSWPVMTCSSGLIGLYLLPAHPLLWLLFDLSLSTELFNQPACLGTYRSSYRLPKFSLWQYFTVLVVM